MAEERNFVELRSEEVQEILGTPPGWLVRWGTMVVLLGFGLLCRFRIAYLVGWMIIVGCLVLEHWIARRRSLNWINVAFFRLNAVVSAVFLFVTLAEIVFGGGFRLR